MQRGIRIDVLEIHHDGLVYRVWYKRAPSKRNKGRAWRFTVYDKETSITVKYKFCAGFYNEFFRVPFKDRHLVAENFMKTLKPMRVATVHRAKEKRR